MSLDNVYYWHNNNWQKITAEEYVKNHPNIKVAADKKIFWCEMCGQFVTLANGNINKEHFRHSSADLKKDCKDRLQNFAKNDWVNSNIPHHNLPIKICVDKENFHFEIGLIKLPSHLYDAVKNCRIKITSDEKVLLRRDLSDWLIEDKITWLDIKDFPSKTYSLILEPEISAVHFYWNKEITGVIQETQNKNSYGTLFDVRTGRKILYDADVKIDTKYYLLISNKSERNFKGVNVKKMIRQNGWTLYEVEATKLSEDAAKFFLHYHCRLTEKPLFIKPIYPAYVQDGDIIHCDSSKIFFYCLGSVKAKLFSPSQNSRELETKNNIIEVEVNEPQQMLAAGRTQPLQYLYVWKDLQTSEIEFPQVKVTDLKENPVTSGVYHKLPKDSILQVSAGFDIQIVTIKNNVTTNKIFLKSGNFSDVPVNFGTEIKIFQGLDCIFEIAYKRETKDILQADEELFLKLERGGGKKLKISHTFGSFADKLKDYPKVKSWLYKNIRAGFVNEESYLLLRQFILKVV